MGPDCAWLQHLHLRERQVVGLHTWPWHRVSSIEAGLVYANVMRAIPCITLRVGISIFLTSSSLWAQRPAPPPPAPAPPLAAQPYPGQPPYAASYPRPPYGAQPYYGPPPYGYVPRPARIPYNEGPVPPGYHLEEGPRKGLVISGAVVFGVPYLLSATIGLSSSNTADRWLLLPVFGPHAALASRSNRCSDDVACVFEPIVRIYLALDFVTQATGALLFGLGFAFLKKEFVIDQAYPSGSAFRLKSWALAPRIFEGSKPGLALSGEIF